MTDASRWRVRVIRLRYSPDAVGAGSVLGARCWPILDTDIAVFCLQSAARLDSLSAGSAGNVRSVWMGVDAPSKEPAES